MIPADLSSEMKLAMLVPSIRSEGLVLEEQSLFPSRLLPAMLVLHSRMAIRKVQISSQLLEKGLVLVLSAFA